MGPLGTQELIFIFFLALLLFGPKKLPELGKNFAKAMKEFRKAQSDLKATFDREMANLERETGIKELTATSFQSDSYNYDYSTNHDSYYEGSYDSHNSPTSLETTSSTTLTTGASATLGAGSTPLQIEAAHGSIASGRLDTSYEASYYAADTHSANGHTEPVHPEASHEAHVVVTEKPVNS
jgi:TatA/E family protein of Tat protein translocase